MGCKYCTSGLGDMCDGPMGLDDLEVGCDCSCHTCPIASVRTARTSSLTSHANVTMT